MNMLISILSDLGGWIVLGIGAVASVWFGINQIKGGERAKIAGETAKVELAAGKVAASARKRVVAADDAERQRLRDKYTRPD